jgi:hypothetical protein
MGTGALVRREWATESAITEHLLARGLVFETVGEGNTAAEGVVSCGLIYASRFSKNVIVVAWRSLLSIVGTPQSQ